VASKAFLTKTLYARDARRGETTMSETETTATEVKAESTLNGAAAQETQAQPEAQPAAAPPADPVAKAKEFYAAVREVGTKWAEVGLGYGRVALEKSARALEEAAQKLGALQERLKKAPAPAA
jgi:uncharacterized membrane protein